MNARTEMSAAMQQAGWLDAVLCVASHYQLDASRERIRVAAQWSQHSDPLDTVRQMALQAGLSFSPVQPQLNALSPLATARHRAVA